MAGGQSSVLATHGGAAACNKAVAAVTAPVAVVQDRMQSAVFHRSLWGDHFLAAAANTDQEHPTGELGEYEVMKEEVRRMVTIGADNNDEVAVIQKLQLIDEIQRLGIGYHFETEIEATLESVYVLGGESFIENHSDIILYHAALWFRLLRQQGFRVSPDGFRRFKDDEGKFKESLMSDEQGLLSLYEAAHVAFHEEDILDEALGFTTKNLKSMILDHKTSALFKKQAEFSLSLPAWKCIPRILARHSIEVYSELYNHTSHDQAVILKFAKLDFNMVQKCHQQELHELTLWWASLETKTRFPYAKDRLAECYFWINGAYFEPKYRVGRLILAKCGAVSTLADDVYDNYGEYDELKVLTEAIERADMSHDVEALPNTMKDIFQVIIMNLFKEMEQSIPETGPTYGVGYSIQEFKNMCRSFLVESWWRTESHTPTLEEYLTDANISGGYPFHCTAALLGLPAEAATKEAFDWVTHKTNKMVLASSAICRLQNDIMSHHFERKRMHVASAVECYMTEHDVSDEEAAKFLWGEISKAWKDIAEEYCCCREKPTPVHVTVMSPTLNLARVISVMYGKGDAYTHPHLLKEHIAALFDRPVPV